MARATITGLVSHPVCEEHYAGPGHPESPERLAAVLARLERSGLAAECERVAARAATDDEVARVHGARHVTAIELAAAGGRGLLDDGDTYVCEASFEAAKRAVGGVLDAALRVREGAWSNAFCALRPPGHHAEESRALGFCLFNQVAVAARSLTLAGVARVAIVDFDVHHGNGTQHLFEQDASVFYASLHQYPHYPGTGAARERGIGAGEGATLNLPQPAGSGDAEWLRAFEDALLPALDDFRPEFVLVSAGFDAHARDPLSHTLLSTDAFGTMTEHLLDVARRHAGGRLVSVLEGGYDLEALADCAELHVAALRGAGS